MTAKPRTRALLRQRPESAVHFIPARGAIECFSNAAELLLQRQTPTAIQRALPAGRTCLRSFTRRA